VCTPYGTTTAVTAPSTAISTRSCAEDGFPATWTRTATGTCIAPVVATAPVASGITVGASCGEGGIAGYYGYPSGSATVACIPYATASTAAPTNTVATTPTAATTATTTPTIGSPCTVSGSTGYYGYSGASIICIPYTAATTATTIATTATVATTPATIAASLVGTWAYNTGDGTATTSCNYNGTMRCGWYYTSNPGSYSLGPPQ